ncbi:MAG: glycine zipper 2TM domain-containing protein [Alphaproteobacteria bacterium]|nr:glycine zipper 2TM domain-containing protein [Alphaproteobacteria bacterium]
MNASKYIALFASTALLAACSQPMGQAGGGFTQGGSSINKQDVGTIAGAIGGGVLGHNIGKGKGQTVATIAGTLLGAGLGSSIGASLDKADMAMYHDTSQRALENAQPGQALPWKNPQTGNYGSVTPSNYYQNSQGQYCREYSQNIVVGGKSEQGFGKACRQPDGSWQIVQ